MVDGTAMALLFGAALVYFAALGIVDGVKKVGHGAKVVACKLHVAHCAKPAAKP